MKKELKIGVFAVITLVVTFFVINYLRGKDIFNREIELVSRYESLEGLVASAPVYIKGYKVGSVSAVEYDVENEDFKVTCSILKEFRIPIDSKMTIYSVDIMGGKGIRIDLGTSTESASDGYELAPSSAPDLLGSLGDNIGPLMEKVSMTLDSLSITVGSVNQLLSDSNKASISNTLRHLESTMKDVRSLASSVNDKSEELNVFIDNLSGLSDRLNDIAASVDTTISGVSSVVDTLNESDIRGVIESFNSLLHKINDPEGTMGKILTDDSVYNSVDSLLNDVDELVKKIQENPKKYIRISVF